jgi:hypothetical protein
MLMELLDPDTKVYINAWTWGYEDILKAVARRFGSKVNRHALRNATPHSLVDPCRPIQGRSLRLWGRPLSEVYHHKLYGRPLSCLREN